MATVTRSWPTKQPRDSFEARVKRGPQVSEGCLRLGIAPELGVKIERSQVQEWTTG
jgi:hypothetical protein